MNYVGVDLHKESSWFYIMNESGKRMMSKNVLNSPDVLNKFFQRISSPFYLAVEATYNWYFFVDIAEQYAEEVYLANSYELKAFAKRHKKTDKIDARLISDVLRKDMRELDIESISFDSMSSSRIFASRLGASTLVSKRMVSWGPATTAEA